MHNKCLKMFRVCELIMYKLLQNIISCAILALEYCLNNYHKLEELKVKVTFKKLFACLMALIMVMTVTPFTAVTASAAEAKAQTLRKLRLNTKQPHQQRLPPRRV